MILKAISIFLCLISLRSQGQIKIKKVLASANPVPPNWVELLINDHKWRLTKQFYYDGERVRKTFDFDNSPVVYQFKKDSIIHYNINEKDTSAVTYFTNEKTFKTFDQNGHKVYYIDSTYIILEYVHPEYFDFNTGKRLTEAEQIEKMKAESKKIDSAGKTIVAGRRIDIRIGNKADYYLLYVYKKE